MHLRRGGEQRTAAILSISSSEQGLTRTIPLTSLAPLPGTFIFRNSDAGVSFVTPPNRWAFSLEVQVPLPGNERCDATIKVRMSAQSGALGVGWVRRDRTDWVARGGVESAAMQDIELLIPAGTVGGSLVFDNWTLGDKPAVGLIDSIEVSVAENSAATTEIRTGGVLFGGARFASEIAEVVDGWLGQGGRRPDTTAPEQYAELLRVPASPQATSLSGPFALCVEMQVHKGAIGVRALKHSRQEEEWWAYPSDEPVTVILPVLDPADFDGLAIRNLAENRPSVVALGSFAAFALDLSAEGVFVGPHDNRSIATEAALTDAYNERGFGLSRGKWSELPCYTGIRITSGNVNAASDADLLSFYDENIARMLVKDAAGNKLMGHWTYALYLEAFRGKRVLDVGSGLGYDAQWFASNGADWTCADIVESNLTNIRRISELRGLPIKTHYLHDLSSFDELGMFDFIWCHGSMINAPFSFSARESQKLLEHLPIGGRWIELCYPKVRWEREGHLPFHRWGERTDGIGTPWMEWYDTEKLLCRLQPARFYVYLAFNINDDAFNWFDLLRLG